MRGLPRAGSSAVADLRVPQVKPLYLSLFLLSVFVPALATVAKEGIFTDAKKKLGRWGPRSSLQGAH